MTLQLCGFSASNYYNKLKLQLLEKEAVFEELLIWTDRSDTNLVAASPLAKVPYLQTERGPVCESMACAEYIETVFPQHPLLPQDAYAAAKVRELILFMELHLELVARELYPEAFFGGKVSDGTKERARKLLEKGARGLAQLTTLTPFAYAGEFSLADCAAIVHLPLVSSASKIIFDEDLLAALPVRDYLKRMGDRATVRKVTADRKASTELLVARYRAKPS